MVKDNSERAFETEEGTGSGTGSPVALAVSEVELVPQGGGTHAGGEMNEKAQV
jgi:hypothetical protein